MHHLQLLLQLCITPAVTSATAAPWQRPARPPAHPPSSSPAHPSRAPALHHHTLGRVGVSAFLTGCAPNVSRRCAISRDMSSCTRSCLGLPTAARLLHKRPNHAVLFDSHAPQLGCQRVNVTLLRPRRAAVPIDLSLQLRNAQLQPRSVAGTCRRGRPDRTDRVPRCIGLQRRHARLQVAGAVSVRCTDNNAADRM